MGHCQHIDVGEVDTLTIDPIFSHSHIPHIPDDEPRTGLGSCFGEYAFAHLLSHKTLIVDKRLRNSGTVSAPWINHYSIDRKSLLIFPNIHPTNVHFHAQMLLTL